MITIFAAIAGMVIGAATALKRGGNRMDAVQYGAGFGIAFALIGMAATIVLARNFMG